MTTTQIIANGCGVLSTLCFIASFQVKSNKGLYIIQSLANIFYGLQFYLLGAMSGLFNMSIQIVRNLLICKKDEWKWLGWKGMAPLLCVPSLIYMVATWSGPLDLFPVIAMTAGTLCYWTASAKIIRLSELVAVAPAWITYDFFNGAYGGVLNEVVILISVIVSIARFGWNGLDALDDISKTSGETADTETNTNTSTNTQESHS